MWADEHALPSLQLESEKERRVQSVAEEDTTAGAAAPPQEA